MAGTEQTHLSCHEPLTDAGRQIRLLRFTENQEHVSGIHCELSTWTLSSAPRYVASSYTWGLVEDACDITIHERLYEIRRNCFHALRQIRRHDSEAFVWIDSICINQSDLDEKALQVEIMGDIYRQAETVYSCLGEHENGSEVLFPLFRDLSAYIREHWDEEATYTISERISEMTAKETGDRNEDGVPEDIVRSYGEFGERPYWRRLWIVQELRIAHRCVLLCGPDHLRLEDTRLCLEKEARDAQQASRRNDFPLTMMWAVIQGNWMPPRTISWGIPVSGERLPKVTLTTAIARYHTQQCSDPRDRLYALANVVDWPEPMQPPKPNYRISLWDLLSEFLEQLRHIDWKKMDHHYSTVLELLVIGLDITIREERIRQAIRQRAALYPSSNALVDSTELFYTGSNSRGGRLAVHITNFTEGKLYMAENDEAAFESSLDQSTDEKNKNKAPRALWFDDKIIGHACPRTRAGDYLVQMSLDVDEERWIVVREYKSCESQLQYYEIVGTSIIVEEYIPDVLFDLLDMEEYGSGWIRDLDVCFDEKDYLLWLAYTHSVDMGVLSDEEIGEYLRYEVTRFDLSSFAVLREEEGTSDEE